MVRSSLVVNITASWVSVRMVATSLPAFDSIRSHSSYGFILRDNRTPRHSFRRRQTVISNKELLVAGLERRVGVIRT